MKVTVKEKTENEIDFSVAGQYLINHAGRIVITSGEYKCDKFSATSLNDISNVHQGEYFDGFNKHEYKKFNGTITIEQ